MSDHVQQLVEGLKKQHGDKYTRMQCCLWSEMINGGLYKNMTDLPTTSMFNCCGGESTPIKKESSVKEAVIL